MRKISREELREIIKKEYEKLVETVNTHKANLDNYMETIKKLEELKIYSSNSYKIVYEVENDEISLSSGRLSKYEIESTLIGFLYRKGYKDLEVERAIGRTLERIDRLYEVNKNTITKKTYGVVGQYNHSKDYYVDDYELSKYIENMINLFNLEISKENLYTKFHFGNNEINDKYVLKVFKNGKIKLIEK